MTIADHKLLYPISLILSTEIKKTAQSLAKASSTSSSTMLRRLDHSCVTVDDLIVLAKKYFGNSKLSIIIDDSLISKRYSKFIRGSGDNYDTTIKQTYRSVCFIAIMLTDGHYSLPLDHKIWMREKFVESYRSKEKLAQELLGKIRHHWPHAIVLMDGLYATPTMFAWLNENKMRFETRIHSNRVIEHKGTKAGIKKHPALQLKNDWKRKTIKAIWKGIGLYITVVKRKLKKGSYIITYQASNYKSLARTHMSNYSYRWNIEKFFRTAKQSLGLAHCQSVKQKLQENHIMNVFGAFAILQN
ncbi:transposase [Candidatus Dependentiae bacterium]|nr:transposase [Candidatus Dependentiae bacterium]